MKRCIQCNDAYEANDWVCPACEFQPVLIDGLPAFAPESAVATSGFRADAFAELATLESGNFWFHARNELIVWALRRCFPGMRSFLEIGCGTGFVLEGVASAFPDVRVAGSEILSAGLPFAAKRVVQADLLQMDARQIPYQGEFDVIGAFDVLEHIEEDEGVLAEIHRALVPGGGVILTVPQHMWLWSSTDQYACHVRRYAVGEMAGKLQRAGFRVELQTSFVSLLLPLMYVSRWMRRNSKSDDVTDELRLSPILNRIFLAAMALERWAIKAGVRFPLGGSGLVFARKVA